MLTQEWQNPPKSVLRLEFLVGISNVALVFDLYAISHRLKTYFGVTLFVVNFPSSLRFLYKEVILNSHDLTFPFVNSFIYKRYI